MAKSPRKVAKGRSAEKSVASKRVTTKQPQAIGFGRTGYVDYGVDPTKGRKPKRK